MSVVYLGIGSNIGDRRQFLDEAVERINEFSNAQAISSVYETEPWGYEDQPGFLNQVLSIETDNSPQELLQKLKAIEVEIGRKPTFRYGPRVIDIDILFFDDLRVQEADLCIPHSQIPYRAFVLIPLAEIAPDLYHPTELKTISEMVQHIDRSGVTLYSETSREEE